MVSVTARRASEKQTATNQENVPSALTNDIAGQWVAMTAIEQSLADFSHNGSGVIAWRAAPSAQGLVAALLSANLQADDKIICAGGIQSYQWQLAKQVSAVDVFKINLGKIFPENVVVSSIEDAIAMADARLNVIAIHVETEQDLENIREISAAAVKAQIPTLVVVSTSVSVPVSTEIEVLDVSNADAVKKSVVTLHTAIHAVREQGAIRVVACPDIMASEAENVMMQVAEMNPENWALSVSNAQDNIDQAATASCLASVETF